MVQIGVRLENRYIILEADEKGAEMTRISDKEDGIEYLWNGDPSIWDRRAPILFPIIGRLKNNEYRLDGKSYRLSPHGFARDSDFDVVSICADSALFRLCWTEESINIYPYKFELDVRYLLSGNTVEVSYTVRNVGDENMYFSIGAHPGFNCPFINEGGSMSMSSFEDYYFEFGKKETCSTLIVRKDGLLTRETEPILNDSSMIPLSRELFANDALIFNNLESKKISLKNHKNSKALSVDFSDFPCLGLWSKPEGAAFVCIEPWLGHGDFEDFEGDFKEKDGVLELKVADEFSCKYCISILM